MAQVIMWSSGPESALPPPGVRNRLYIAEDKGRWFLDDGIAWQPSNLAVQGDWQNTVGYKKHDVVKSGGSWWLALASSIGVAPVEGATWTLFASKGDRGYSVLNGIGAPAAGVGIDGDFYIDTSASNLYGPKTAGAWGAPRSLVGPQGSTGPRGFSVLNGAGVPAGGIGVDGDFYINTSANTIYGPKTAGAWGAATSLVGPQGIQGVQGVQGIQGVPGVDGRTVLNGSGAPAAGLGANGDFYIDNTAHAIYGPKTAGAWGASTSLVGPQGAPGAGNIVSVFGRTTPDIVAQANDYSYGQIAGAPAKASQAAADAGTDDATYMTPIRVADRIATRAPATAPFVNMMNDSGKFTNVEVDPLALTLTATWANNVSFFTLYNSAVAASGGKFISNNTTNGGTAGALTQDIIDLLTAMGRGPANSATSRYGTEFFITTYTAGAGTLVPTVFQDGITRYTITINNTRSLFAFNKRATAVFWIRLKTAGASGNKVAATFQTRQKMNGIEQSDSSLIGVADGWTHIWNLGQTSIGYNTEFPNIKARSGDVVQIALPAFFAGEVDPGVHTAPLPSINELMS